MRSILHKLDILKVHHPSTNKVLQNLYKWYLEEKKCRNTHTHVILDQVHNMPFLGLLLIPYTTCVELPFRI